jgi:hypothetical protein
MLRALAGVVVLSVALTGCRSSGDAPAGGGPSPTASATARPDDVALVKAALEKTRAAATATYVLDSTITLTEGTLTTHTEGAYDLAEARARAVRTFEAEPPGVLAAISGDARVRAADMEARTVTTEVAAYLQMPGWPAPADKRWLRFDERDLRRLQRSGGGEVSLEVFPALLEMLTYAEPSPKDGSGRARVPAYAEVLVPAAQAFAALPTSASRRIVAAGLDPAQLTGSVEVTVEVDQGYVTMVSVDAYDLMQQAYGLVGLKATVGAAFTEFGVGLMVNDHGKPVRIPLPPDAQVMTQQEFAELDG